MSNGVNQCAACGGLWDDDEPHVACPSDHPSDPTDKAVALLKTIGLDITYTDEGLRVVAERIGRLYVNAPRTLTADDPEPAVGQRVRWNGCDAKFVGYEQRALIEMQPHGQRESVQPTELTLIHDGEATP